MRRVAQGRAIHHASPRAPCPPCTLHPTLAPRPDTVPTPRTTLFLIRRTPYAVQVTLGLYIGVPYVLLASLLGALLCGSAVAGTALALLLASLALPAPPRPWQAFLDCGLFRCDALWCSVTQWRAGG